MKTLATVSNETSTGDRQGVRHAQVPESRPVSVFFGGIPPIQRKNLCACDGGCPRCSGVIQPKLTIGAPDDKYEQEADRVADQVMRMPDPAIQRSAGCSSCGDLDEDQIQTKSIGDQITPLVQRQEDPEEEEESVQPKGISNKSPPVTTGLGHRILSMRGGGQPLSTLSRAFFEPRFGRDLGDVRVHTGANAAEVSDSVRAKAFTTGKDVVFGAGQYAPGTGAGQRLLAHELTHVVQQSGSVHTAAIQRQPHSDFPGTNPYDFPPVGKCAFDPVRFYKALRGDLASIRHVLDCCYDDIPIVKNACLSDVTDGLCKLIGQKHKLCKTPGKKDDSRQCSPPEHWKKGSGKYKNLCCKKTQPQSDKTCCKPDMSTFDPRTNISICCPPGTRSKKLRVGRGKVKIGGCECLPERKTRDGKHCCLPPLVPHPDKNECVHPKDIPPPDLPPCSPFFHSPLFSCSCPPERMNLLKSICCREGEMHNWRGDCVAKPPPPKKKKPPPKKKKPPVSQRTILFHQDFPQYWNTFTESVINHGEFKKLVKDLENDPEKRVQLVGHASSEGGDYYNLTLSKRRVKLVASELKQELKKKGINSDERIKKSPDPAGSAGCERDKYKEGRVYCGEGKASPEVNEKDRNVVAELFVITGAGQTSSSPLRSNPVLQEVFDGKKVMGHGDRGEAVRLIQVALMNAGFPLPLYGADGIFGSETGRAVNAFQDSAGLGGNEIIDSSTITSLDSMNM